jgi:DNA-binding IclR family transcriptional regulator
MFRFVDQRSAYRNDAGEALASVEKAIEVLFHLSGERDARGVSEIGRALGLPKSSTHRLLAALSRRGLVERDERGRYRPGIGLVSLGLGALEREPVAVAARPVLEAEAAALGETVFLVTARAGSLCVLDKVEGTGFLRAAPRVGESVPVHATAVGKLFLAFAPGEVELARGPLERFTERTRSDAASLARDVERARRLGFAENREEWIPGLSVVAAPVLRGERMLGALAVAAPTARLRALGATARARVTGAARSVAGRLAGGRQAA